MKFMAVPGLKCIPIMSNSLTAMCFSRHKPTEHSQPSLFQRSP